MSVEVQGVAVDQLTVDHLPLLVEPTLGRVVAPREHDVVALESAREIIPCRRDERVFALQVLDDLVTCGLCRGGKRLFVSQKSLCLCRGGFSVENAKRFGIVHGNSSFDENEIREK